MNQADIDAVENNRGVYFFVQADLVGDKGGQKNQHELVTQEQQSTESNEYTQYFAGCRFKRISVSVI